MMICFRCGLLAFSLSFSKVLGRSHEMRAVIIDVLRVHTTVVCDEFVKLALHWSQQTRYQQVTQGHLTMRLLEHASQCNTQAIKGSSHDDSRSAVVSTDG